MIRIVFAIGLLGAGVAMGQASAGPASTPAAPSAAGKPMAFDVVSIRQNVAQQMRNGPPVFGPTADGYRMVSAPLILPIITAYVPTVGAAAFTPDQITGLPDWAMRDAFDIDAKVAEEDLPEWQKPASQKAMLQTMMQSLLTDRCKMAVHREVKEVAVYSMVVGKGGPKFKATNPDEKHEGMKLPFGGTMSPGQNGMTLYAAPMSSVAFLLSTMGRMGTGRPIVDKTGLTGLYDIVISMRDMAPTSGGPEGGASDPGGGGLATMVVEALGLKLEPSKASVETLVIDHIEKPSAN
jgi:uncharacterized protein (TIGR03435 family)